MKKLFLMGLFSGVVLLHPCVYAMDGKGSTAVAEAVAEKNEEQIDNVASAAIVAIVQVVAKIIPVYCDAEITSLEGQLEKLENLKKLSGIGNLDYNAQKAELSANLETVRQAKNTSGAATLTAMVTAIVTAGLAQGPESEAGQRLLNLVASCEETSVSDTSDGSEE